MNLVLHLIPIIIISVLVIFKQHMLFAGLCGLLVAMIINGIEPATAGLAIQNGISTMLGYTAPIIYAAAAMMVSKSGSIQAIVKMAQNKLKDKIAIFAGFLVLIQALATYMAGMGAGNTMVIAPLVASSVGVIPEVVAGMAIATASCLTTTPNSTETILTSEAAKEDVTILASKMMPIMLIMVSLGVALAIYGVYKKGTLVKEKQESKDDFSDEHLFIRSIPAIALLIFVIFGNKLNTLIGIKIFVPGVNLILTAILTALLTPLSISKTCAALGEGSHFILTTLFTVGIFLGFINTIAETGVFVELASLVSSVPNSIVIPCAMIIAFIIAIPSGAMAASTLALILPTLALTGMSSIAMAFVAMATSLGTQISPVQINVAALSQGFNQEISDIVKGNTRWVVGALALLIILSFFFC
jgi:hypothetical protein